jgi:hypothetical protein
MVRVLNFFCVALMGLSILALYHVSEKTRVAHLTLSKVNRDIGQEKSHLNVLETEWQHVASPAQIQKLAVARLGMGDSASVQLSSFDLLPRRGAEPAPLNDAPLRNANAEIPAASTPAAPVPTSHSGM